MTRYLPALAALSLATPLAADPPRVVADIPPVHSLVSMVMQGVGEADLLIPATASPHDYALRPSDARALSGADLVVMVGPLLSPWLEGPLDSLAGDAHRLVLMETEGMTLYGFREGAWFAKHDHDHEGHDDHDDHAKHDDHDDHDHAKHDDHDDHDHAKHDDHDDHKHDDDHAHDDHDHDKDHDDHDHAKHDDHDAHEEDHAGHDHGDGKDPHIWLDPVNAIAAVAAIAEELAELDPENADRYRQNATDAQGRLEGLSAEITARMAPAKGAGFIVFHDAYHYFEHRYGVEASGSVNPGDAASAGAARIAELRENLGETAVKCAFSEPQMNQSLLQTVVEGQDVTLAVMDPLGVSLTPGADLYPELLTALSTTLADCLTK